MKKRLLTAALVALLPLSLAACGGQSKQAACQIINDKAVKAIDGLDPSNTEDMVPQRCATRADVHHQIVYARVWALKGEGGPAGPPSLLS